MSGTIVPLAEVAEVKLGRQRSPKNHDGPNMRKYLRAANVGWSGLLLDDVKEMNFTDTELAQFRLEPGDILLNEASGSPREVGKPALWQGELDDCAFQNTLLRVRPSDQVDSRYLLHFFRREAESGEFVRGSRGTGINHLGRAALAQWSIPLPPIEEQRRIAAILDHADALRAKRREALARLDELTQSIFIDMFGSQESKCEVPFAEIAEEFRYGTSVKATSDGDPVLRIPNVVGGSLDVRDMKYVLLEAGEFDRLHLREGDLLFVRTNGNPENVGRCAVFDEARLEKGGLSPSRCVYASYLIRSRVDESRVHPRFLSFYFNGAGRRRLTANAKTSAGQYNINIQGLGSTRVPLPPVDKQASFVQQVTQIEASMEVHRAASTELDALFASLQSRAFRGEL